MLDSEEGAEYALMNVDYDSASGPKSLKTWKKCWISDHPFPDVKGNVYLDGMTPQSWSIYHMESGPLGLLERNGDHMKKSESSLKLMACYNPSSSQNTTTREQEKNKCMRSLEFNFFVLLTW